ncbi:hypothetical protein GGR54DRAFT_257026 [Hypoxylon sp. NC1633]|nr:hypothetical protein GGR54DRAFT_257026 [Hypoxylon sp. NC1633]
MVWRVSVCLAVVLRCCFCSCYLFSAAVVLTPRSDQIGSVTVRKRGKEKGEKGRMVRNVVFQTIIKPPVRVLCFRLKIQTYAVGSAVC